MRKFSFIILLFSCVFLFGCQTKPIQTIVTKATDLMKENNTIKIGWVSELSGKFGGIEAGSMAIEEINNAGGVGGKRIELIIEDGKCDSEAAIIAMLKLVEVDKVKFILGGSCSPESMAMAPIAEATKTIMLAFTTTSKLFTNIGDYTFRTSPSTNGQVELTANYFREKNIKKIAILYEQTDYARPLAEDLKNIVESNSGEVLVNESYAPGTVDFTMVLKKINDSKPQAIFLSPQYPESVLIILKQIKELGISTQLFGNDVFGSQSMIDDNPALFEGLIFYDLHFDTINKKTSNFIEAYKKIYNSNLPAGVNTAIVYDTVYILVDGIKKCGENVECVKEYLYSVKDYDGVVGKISIDNNGDGALDFVAKTIESGRVIDYIEDFKIYSK